MKFWFFIISVIVSQSLLANVKIETYPSAEFVTGQNQVFKFPIRITEKGILSVRILTSDGDLVRELPQKTDNNLEKKAGFYEISWDGKDAKGEQVPDEAYIPVVTLTTAEKVLTFDPRENSGGEEIAIHPRVEPDNTLIFELQKPARILARAGIKSGPLLKNIAHWEIRNTGRNRITWDGYDEDKLIQLSKHQQLSLVVTGFALPDHVVITRGNHSLNYLQWRRQNGWTSDMPDLSERQLDREGNRISRHYYLPRSLDIEPEIFLNTLQSLSRNNQGKAIVSDAVSFQVKMSEEDRIALQQSRFEVAFFLDNAFISEEEQGYVPLTWRWDPDTLEPGLHTMTVNVSGFNGQVGVRSLQFYIPES